MKGDPLQTVVLAAKLIPNARPELVKELTGLEGIEVPQGTTSLALISTDCDDVTYTAVSFFSVEDVIRVRFVNTVDSNISEYKFDKNIEDKLTLTGNINAEKTTAKLNALEELHKEAMRRLSDYAVTFAIAVSKNGSES